MKKTGGTGLGEYSTTTGLAYATASPINGLSPSQSQNISISKRVLFRPSKRPKTCQKHPRKHQKRLRTVFGPFSICFGSFSNRFAWFSHRCFRFFGVDVVARSFSSIVAVVVAVVGGILPVVVVVVGCFRWDMYMFTSLLGDTIRR